MRLARHPRQMEMRATCAHFISGAATSAIVADLALERDQLVVVGQEELEKRHHLEPCRVLQQALHVRRLARLQQPACTVDEDRRGEDG